MKLQDMMGMTQDSKYMKSNQESLRLTNKNNLTKQDAKCIPGREKTKDTGKGAARILETR